MSAVVTFDPVVLLLLGIASWLYVRAVRVAARARIPRIAHPAVVLVGRHRADGRSG